MKYFKLKKLKLELEKSKLLTLSSSNNIKISKKNKKKKKMINSQRFYKSPDSILATKIDITNTWANKNYNKDKIPYYYYINRVTI